MFIPRPGDRQVMHGLYQVYERNQTHFQIGDNTNLFDWTYVGNVAKAHLLAADRLDASSILEAPISEQGPLSEQEEEAITIPLPSIEVTTHAPRVPTSKARPLGPYKEKPADAEKIASAFNTHPSISLDPVRTVRRSKFDQFSADSLKDADHSPLQVDGQIFFITNGEPTYFWDFPRAVWRHLDACHPPRPKKRQIQMPRFVGMALASAAEWWGWLVGKEPAFTRFRVQFSCATRWYNIEKARRALGYEPDVGLEDGINLMVDVISLLFLNEESLISLAVVEKGERKSLKLTKLFSLAYSYTNLPNGVTFTLLFVFSQCRTWPFEQCHKFLKDLQTFTQPSTGTVSYSMPKHLQTQAHTNEINQFYLEEAPSLSTYSTISSSTSTVRHTPSRNMILYLADVKCIHHPMDSINRISGSAPAVRDVLVDRLP